MKVQVIGLLKTVMLKIARCFNEDIIQKLVQKSPNAAKDTPNLVASSAAGPVISKVEKP